MPLFDVPGWSMPANPVQEEGASKKRKRRVSQDNGKVQSAAVNFEKLLEKLDAGEDSARPGPQKRQKKRAKKNAPGGPQLQGSSDPPHAQADHAQAEHAERPRKAGKQEKKKPQLASTPFSSQESKKDPKFKLRPDSQPQKDAKAQSAEGTSRAEDGLTTLQAGMKSSLDGARFRWINEILYKSDSEHAHQMMREDPKVFEEYHTGFRHQVHSWPTNPVSYYISSLSAYPPKTVIADLGCGDAALARALVPKGMSVLSFDLISDGTFVIEADICGRLPLPGSEGNAEDKKSKSEGEGAIVDVVVCALSLMGTNWPKCLREAWRVLRPSGELRIAEVASRFADIDEFTSLVSSVGFKLKSKDDRNSHFTLFEFEKVPRNSKSEKEWNKLVSRGSILKPCEYKRR